MKLKEHTYEELIEITKKVIKEFEKVEQKPWGVEGSMIELMKQIGDLSKHVMVFEKYYLKERENNPDYKTTKENIADELADIWFCLIRLSEHYKIDLKKSILKARTNDFKSLGVSNEA